MKMVKLTMMATAVRAWAPRNPVSYRTTARFLSTSMDFCRSEIDTHNVVVFAKSYCPHSKAAKELLRDMEIDHTIHDLDLRDDGADIQAALLELTGQTTVPNVFVKGQHLGGNDKTQEAAKSGKLQEMLQSERGM